MAPALSDVHLDLTEQTSGAEAVHVHSLEVHLPVTLTTGMAISAAGEEELQEVAESADLLAVEHMATQHEHTHEDITAVAAETATEWSLAGHVTAEEEESAAGSAADAVGSTAAVQSLLIQQPQFAALATSSHAQQDRSQAKPSPVTPTLPLPAQQSSHQPEQPSAPIEEALDGKSLASPILMPMDPILLPAAAAAAMEYNAVFPSAAGALSALAAPASVAQAADLTAR